MLYGSHTALLTGWSRWSIPGFAGGPEWQRWCGEAELLHRSCIHPPPWDSSLWPPRETGAEMRFWGVQWQGGLGAGCSGQQRMLAGMHLEMCSEDGVLGDWRGPGHPGRYPQSGDVAGGCGCRSGPSLGLLGEPEQRGDLCASRKCPSPRPAPGCYFSAIYTQNSHSTAPTPQHWPHPDRAAVLGDPASRSALWGGWEMGPEMGLQGDRPLFTTFFPFPRVTKALPEPPAPR